MQESKRTGTCAYCGVMGCVTSDHVPPKCLFATNSRVNLITVPACHACNSSFKLDDEYFRMVISLRADLPEGSAADFLRDATRRSLLKPQAALLKASLSRSLTRIAINSSDGAQLGELPVMRVDYKRINATASRIVRGLFVHMFQQPLPSTHFVEVKCEDLQKDDSAIEDPQIKEVIAILGQSGVRHESNDTIEAWAKLADDDLYSSFWHFKILKTIKFFAFTLPKRS
jgi:hypothetical protein